MPVPVTRRRTVAAALAVGAACGAAALVPATASAKAPRLITAHHVSSVGCLPSAGDTVRADVRLNMSVVNYHGFLDWADHMEARARLESTGPGLNIHSRWAKWKSPYLLQDKRHFYNVRLVTDNKSGSASWRVHLKLIWHRTAPTPNVTKDVYLRFDGSCAPQTGGGAPTLLPAAPAPPSAGAGA